MRRDTVLKAVAIQRTMPDSLVPAILASEDGIVGYFGMQKIGETYGEKVEELKKVTAERDALKKAKGGSSELADLESRIETLKGDLESARTQRTDAERERDKVHDDLSGEKDKTKRYKSGATNAINQVKKIEECVATARGMIPELPEERERAGDELAATLKELSSHLKRCEENIGVLLTFLNGLPGTSPDADG